MSTIQQSSIVSGLSRKGIAPPSFIGALGVIGAFVLAALFAPLVLGDDPFANHFIPGGGLARYLWPSPAFPFGTNVYGQDVFQQTLLGAQRTLVIGFVSGAIIMIIATLIGVVSGYFGGLTDAVLMRITDFFYAIPFLPFSLIFVHFFGTSSVLGLRRNRLDLLADGSAGGAVRGSVASGTAVCEGSEGRRRRTYMDYALSYHPRCRRHSASIRRIWRGMGHPHRKQH